MGPKAKTWGRFEESGSYGKDHEGRSQKGKGRGSSTSGRKQKTSGGKRQEIRSFSNHKKSRQNQKDEKETTSPNCKKGHVENPKLSRILYFLFLFNIDLNM